MASIARTKIPELLKKHQRELLKEWLAAQANLMGGQAGGGEMQAQSQPFVEALQKATAGGQIGDLSGPEWREVIEILNEVSSTGAQKGMTPVQTATFVFSLKEPLFNLLKREIGKDAEALVEEIWTVTRLLDKLGLYTTEIFQKSREQVIGRQQEELMELSTPVVQLWEGILALPLIGTLDSARTQVVMENLLQEIVKTGAEIAIIDITGVPTVDTVVAQHLIKTVSAARLMGADCIISGIRPQIAQTIVHLGVELDVISKATMADAFGLALRRTGRTITTIRASREAKRAAAAHSPDGDEE
jgi:rsbT co-antagonist protein RsbR